jgi:hypothetical protein
MSWRKSEVLCLFSTIRALINNQKKQTHFLIEGMGAVCVSTGLSELWHAKVPGPDSSACLT